MTLPLPISIEEARGRGWDQFDVIFVTGDAYLDHPSFGVPLLARWLESHGFRVGLISQPDWKSKEPFMALGRPRLFFAVSAGAMDSMVAHYTPQKKLRHDDAYTPGNRHGARPNRACIIYTSRLKEAYKDVPVIIGGIEASLRRFAHYDFWEDKVRRSILVDAKADLLLYGMAERQMLELATRLSSGERLEQITDMRGVCHMSRDLPQGAHVALPSFEQVVADKQKFVEAFRLSEAELNPYCAKTLVQRHGDRLLVCNPPALPLDTAMLDRLYALPFTKEPHPSYTEPIPAYEQIKLSITTHRGCFGGCSFCAIAQHQGKFIQSRSIASVEHEVEGLSRKSWFKGTITDLGGPTANMYGVVCGANDAGAACKRPSCLHPSVCSRLLANDSQAVSMMKKVRAVKSVRHAVISSGIRHDLLERQAGYFSELVRHHVGGLLKLAPEHLVDRVSQLMRKPGKGFFERFLEQFRAENRQCGKNQAVVPYLMAAHPGTTLDDMLLLSKTLISMGLKVEQVQEFTPTPGTAATCMYYTGIDPATGKPMYVARGDKERRLQKLLLLWHLPEEVAKAVAMLKQMGRADLAAQMGASGAAANRSGKSGRAEQQGGPLKRKPEMKKAH
jgi:uncharacterized radical SAM protein YgiQ